MVPLILLLTSAPLCSPASPVTSNLEGSSENFELEKLELFYVSSTHYNSKLTVWLENGEGELSTIFYRDDEVWLFVSTNLSNSTLYVLETPPSNGKHYLVYDLHLFNPGTWKIGPFISEEGDKTGEYTWQISIFNLSYKLESIEELSFNFIDLERVSGEISVINPPLEMLMGEWTLLRVNVENTGATTSTYKVLIYGSGFTSRDNSLEITLPKGSNGEVVFNVTPTALGFIEVNLKLVSDGIELDTSTFMVEVKPLKPGPIVVANVYPASVYVGDEFALTIELENTGSGDAYNVVATIIYLQGFKPLKTVSSIGFLPSKTSGYAYFKLKADSTGSNMVTVEITYKDSSEYKYKEYGRFYLKVSPLPGKLIVRGYSEPMIINESYGLTVEVENTEPYIETFKVKVEAPRFKVSIVEEEVVIRAHGKERLNLTVKPLFEGVNEIKVALIYKGRVVQEERLKINVASFKCNISIESFPDQIVKGASYDLKLKVQNIGYDATYTLKAFSEGFEIEPESQIFKLKRGEETVKTLRIKALKRGEQRIVVYLLFDGEMRSKEIEVNVLSIKSTILGVSKPRKPLPLKENKGSLEIWNSGDAEAQLKLLVNSSKLFLNPQFKEMQLGKGERRNITFSFIGLEPGSYTINFYLYHGEELMDQKTLKVSLEKEPLIQITTQLIAVLTALLVIAVLLVYAWVKKGYELQGH